MVLRFRQTIAMLAIVLWQFSHASLSTTVLAAEPTGVIAASTEGTANTFDKGKTMIEEAATIADKSLSLSSSDLSDAADKDAADKDSESAMPSQTFFISNRVPKPAQSKSEESFTHHRAGFVSYGEINMDGNGDAVCTAKTADKFWGHLENSFSAAGRKPVVVYIHGYRCTVGYSAKVAARMQSVLKCPLILFSWPSRSNPFAYPTDECTAEWSSFQLASVLKDLGKRFGYENIVLVGHSMGCRMICWALQQCKASGESVKPRLRQVIFCAPDIDSLVFEEFSPLLASCAGDTHVFASKKDVRLGISEFVHGSPRLGLVSDAVEKTEEDLHNQATIHFIDYTKKDGFWGHSIPFGLLSQIFIYSKPVSQIVTSAPNAVQPTP